MQTTKKDIVVISLFDGIRVAMSALKKIKHLNVLDYYWSEIDSYAITIGNNQHPETRDNHIGDVRDVNGKELLSTIQQKHGKGVEILLIGGSPCQGFSIAGRMKGSTTTCGFDVVTLESYLQLKEYGFDFDGQSFLFWEYIRLKEEFNPTYWVLENVKITKKWLPMFNETLGRKPYEINSNVFTAQNRKRFYWTNIPVEALTEPSKEVIEDILDHSDNSRLSDKAFAYMNAIVKATSRTYKCLPLKTRWQHCNVNIPSNKSYTLTASMHKGVPHNVLLFHNGEARLLNVLECERLQGYEDGYTQGVSKTKRLKSIGNAFTQPVIEHILNGI